MKKFLNEFKEFAMRGNVLDMSIGIVIGSSFTLIVTSLVNDVFTPIIASLTSNVNFADLSIVLKETEENVITLNYGSFIQAVFNFVIVAFVTFILIRSVNKLNSLKKKKKQETIEEPKKSPELLELEKITSLLEKK